MKTFTPKPADLTHDWYIVDATDVVLGRLAAQVATLLRGKNKPTFAPHADSGNYVIVINASKIALTGDKMGKELYQQESSGQGAARPSARVRRRGASAHRPEAAGLRDRSGLAAG